MSIVNEGDARTEEILTKLFGNKESEAYINNCARINVCIDELLKVKEQMRCIELFYKDNLAWYNPLHLIGMVIIKLAIKSIRKDANKLIDRGTELKKFPDGFRTHALEEETEAFFRSNLRFITTSDGLDLNGDLNKYKLPGK